VKLQADRRSAGLRGLFFFFALCIVSRNIHAFDVRGGQSEFGGTKSDFGGTLTLSEKNFVPLRFPFAGLWRNKCLQNRIMLA
jgi:hypothetical protein